MSITQNKKIRQVTEKIMVLDSIYINPIIHSLSAREIAPKVADKYIQISKKLLRL